ncbi:hypothetical protein B7486_53350 [cyanobacterium TDX16]|nr:hypothetical protein B7486_53350 [cyanobacterium TDX16]
MSSTRGARRLVTPAALGVSLLLAACAAGGGADVPRDAFRDRLVERDGIAPAEAECVTDAVYAVASPEGIELLHRSALREQPPLADQQAYTYAMVRCALVDDLVDP